MEQGTMNLIKDLKSFASKFETEFKKLFAEIPSWLTIVSGLVTYAGPIAVTLTGLIVGTPAAAATAAILAVIKTDLATIKASVTSGNAAATQGMPALLASLQASLPALLASAKVENVPKVDEIESAVNLLVPELNALLAAAPAGKS
jgi:hypothetical protein